LLLLLSAILAILASYLFFLRRLCSPREKVALIYEKHLGKKNWQTEEMNKVGHFKAIIEIMIEVFKERLTKMSEKDDDYQ